MSQSQDHRRVMTRAEECARKATQTAQDQTHCEVTVQAIRGSRSASYCVSFYVADFADTIDNMLRTCPRAVSSYRLNWDTPDESKTGGHA